MSGATTRRSRPASASSRDPLSSSASHHILSSPITAAPPLASASVGRPFQGDTESLTAEIRLYKEQANAARSENAFLKAQLQRMIMAMRKKDKQMEQITDLKVRKLSSMRNISAVSDSGADAILAGQLRELRAELSTIARLQDKYRDLESAMARKDEELRRARSTLKATNVTELEVENQTYFNEARRMKRGMDQMQATMMQQATWLQQSQQQCAGLQQLCQQQQEQLAQLQEHMEQLQRYPHEQGGMVDSTPPRRSARFNHSDDQFAYHEQQSQLQAQSQATQRLQEEVNQLRAENERLQKEAEAAAAASAAAAAAAAAATAAAAASATAASPKLVASSPPSARRAPLQSSSSLQVLQSITQLQHELQVQVAREAQHVTEQALQEHAQWAEDSAEYADYDAQAEHATAQQTDGSQQPQHQQHQSVSSNEGSLESAAGTNGVRAPAAAGSATVEDEDHYSSDEDAEQA